MEPIRVDVRLLSEQHQALLRSDLLLTDAGSGLENLVSELLFQLENTNGQITILKAREGIA